MVRQSAKDIAATAQILRRIRGQVRAEKKNQTALKSFSKQSSEQSQRDAPPSLAIPSSTHDEIAFNCRRRDWLGDEAKTHYRSTSLASTPKYPSSAISSPGSSTSRRTFSTAYSFQLLPSSDTDRFYRSSSSQRSFSTSNPISKAPSRQHLRLETAGPSSPVRIHSSHSSPKRNQGSHKSQPVAPKSSKTRPRDFRRSFRPRQDQKSGEEQEFAASSSASDGSSAPSRPRRKGLPHSNDKTGEKHGSPQGPASRLERQLPPHVSDRAIDDGRQVVSQGRLSALDIKLQSLDDGRNAPVAILRKNLQRVPFNPGIHMIRDPRTGVWNFDPDQLHDIPSPEEFAYNRTPGYFPPGEDADLLEMATKSKSEYIGSTSTLTKAFSQIYFALSGNRAVDLSYLSLPYLSERTDYSPGARLPACLQIGKASNGAYFVDNDKSLDAENVLTQYGVILEKMLTSEPDDFKRFLVSSPDDGVSEAERLDRGAFNYQKGHKLLMRSQLDCWDPRLPGTGVFDIKTRACVTVRHDRANWKAMSRYDISEERGLIDSFEKEYFDLIRSTMLKYSMQVRIGQMDGIFMAYHNTARNIGFQYLPLEEMDKRLFGSTEMGNSMFNLCTALFESLMDEIVQCFPDQKKVSVTIKQSEPLSARTVSAFVQPTEFEGSDAMRPTQELTLSLRNSIDDEFQSGPIGFSVDEATRKQQNWTVDWKITKSDMDNASQHRARTKLAATTLDIVNMLWLSTPEGKSAKQMESQMKAQRAATGAEPDGTKWKTPDPRTLELRRMAVESGERYLQRKATWAETPGNSWDPIRR